MTLGQKIKKARIEANLTQKELADRLAVTFQTVSKWESDTNEPDLTTLRSIARELNVSLDYLVSEDDNPKPAPEVPIVPMPVPMPVPERRQIGTCADCQSPIMEGDEHYNVTRKSSDGIKKTVMICAECHKKHQDEINRRAEEIEESLNPKPEGKKGVFHKITDRNDKKPLIWSIVFGIVAFAIGLVYCIMKFDSIGLAWTIGAPLIAGYITTATIYCIFTASYISDVFMTIASWSIRFPGIIFTWSLDGFIFLIAMKLVFFVIGVMIGIAAFFLALIISAILSIFSFVPLLIYNKTHY